MTPPAMAMIDTQALHIERDDLSRPPVQALLEEHLAHMYRLSPPEQVFALDLDGLRATDVSFFTVWQGEQLLGCGALKALSPTHGELKSMRTPSARRGRGAGRAMLAHLIDEARRRGYRELSLETGSHPEFRPAQRLYQRFGFRVCGPFADYREDPHSVFMSMRLDRSGADTPASSATPSSPG